LRDEILFLFLNHQKEIRSHSALKKSALPQPSGNEKKEVMMELAKECLESMMTKNTEAISVYMKILEGKISTLDTYDRGISDIMANHPDLREKYSQRDVENLRDLLVVICHNGLKEETLKAVKRRVKDMIDAVSSIEEMSLSDWAEHYLNQYRRFLYDLRELISTEIPLYQASNLAIARELAGLAESGS
jgi:hypothetical protein